MWIWRETTTYLTLLPQDAEVVRKGAGNDPVLLETDRSKSPVPLRAGQEDLLGPGCYTETKP